MAAIVTADPYIREKLQEQRDAVQQKSKKTKKLKTGDQTSTFISVFDVENTHEFETREDKEDPANRCEFKLIVFHCLDSKDQQQLCRNTQFCVVGDYLCHRNR